MAKFVDPNWMIEKGFEQGEITRPSYDSLLEQLEAAKAQLAKK